MGRLAIRRAAAALCLAVTLAAPAAAQMLMLDQPGTEGRLDGRQIDMSVRYEAGDRYKVLAQFTDPFAGEKLADLTIELGDGESVTYSPPGRSQVTYRFARDASVVIVTVHRASRLRLSIADQRQGG